MIFIIIKNKSIVLLLLPFYKNETLDNSIPKVNCINVTIMEKGGKCSNITTTLHKLIFFLVVW